MMNPRKTKIVATIGPASRSPEMIEKLILAGANVFRLNFSHGSREEHLENLTRIREASARTAMPVAVLQDLSGPKIRITNIEGNFATVEDHATVTLEPAGDDLKTAQLSTPSVVYVQTVNPVKILQPGHKVLLADGIIEFEVQAVTEAGAVCKVVKGGRLRSRVGISFPDSSLDLPATTGKDLEDFDWGLKHEVDFVALSFVQNAADLNNLRARANSAGRPVQLIAKIERRAALERIAEIIDASDGIMVARGDLGLEVPLQQVPLIQRDLVMRATQNGVPVIVATQLLQSMVTSVRPTRAEATDVAFAAYSGADALMLSEETTIGERPVECVLYMDRIACAIEEAISREAFDLKPKEADELTIPDAICYASTAAASKVKAAAVIACTMTGNSSRLVSKYRPRQPLFGVSSSESALRKMCLYWGVNPVRIPAAATNKEELASALSAVKKAGAFPDGSTAVLTIGQSFNTAGGTDRMEIRKFGEKQV